VYFEKRGVTVIKYQGKDIKADFHILPIGSNQMVLGVEWLQNFESVTLSYKDQKVKLSTDGKVWEFQGIQAGEIELVQAESMDKSVYQSNKGWVIYVCSKEDNHITSSRVDSSFYEGIM